MTGSKPDKVPADNKATIALTVFVILFVLAIGMLVYYQFYQGYGKWRFTLLHKSNDTTFLIALKTKYDSSKPLNVKTSKKDSSRAKTDTAMQVHKPGPLNADTVYQVQIGTFDNYELKKYNAVFNNLYEEKEGKLTKLTLGQFSKLEDANAFRKDMLKLGIRKAWVVKKVGGKRM